jgi:hypothetical protein
VGLAEHFASDTGLLDELFITAGSKKGLQRVARGGG